MRVHSPREFRSHDQKPEKFDQSPVFGKGFAFPNVYRCARLTQHGRWRFGCSNVALLIMHRFSRPSPLVLGSGILCEPHPTLPSVQLSPTDFAFASGFVGTSGFVMTTPRQDAGTSRRLKRLWLTGSLGINQSACGLLGSHTSGLGEG